MSDLRRLAFGGTIIDLAVARPLQRLSEGMLVPANSRGVMGAGLSGEVRLRAGREVEEELGRYRPLDVGRAYRTGAGRLAQAGVTILAHAVINREPGEPNRPGQDERALAAALELFEEAGARTVTLPTLRLAGGPDPDGRTLAAPLASHLRRRSRIRHLTVAGLDTEYLQRLAADLSQLGATPLDDV
jgi:sugar phosphate isomerase/epimerase